MSEPLTTVAEADRIISGHVKTLPSVHRPLEECYGRILREDLVADRPLPPFNRVTMDGFALKASSFEKGNRAFSIEGLVKAGSPSTPLTNGDACIEIMTGAVLPEGCDCVVPIEQVSVENNAIKLNGQVQVSPMMNVHPRGSDHKKGDALVKSGGRLLGPQIAVAAAVGKAELPVSTDPRITVIGTGDELVAVDQTPLPYQIRQSNSYALQAALNVMGYRDVVRLHLNDDKEEMAATLSSALKDRDIIVLSGGVSMGKFDFVPEVLNELGVKTLFHKVKQRPGKPFWFGVSKDGKPVFALPGNPVSTQVGLIRYVAPYIEKSEGAGNVHPQTAVLEEDVEVTTSLTSFVPVKIETYFDGRILARAVMPENSGDFVSLAHSDGFVELPSETYQFPKGTTARFFPWRSSH